MNRLFAIFVFLLVAAIMLAACAPRRSRKSSGGDGDSPNPTTSVSAVVNEAEEHQPQKAVDEEPENPEEVPVPTAVIGDEPATNDNAGGEGPPELVAEEEDEPVFDDGHGDEGGDWATIIADEVPVYESHSESSPVMTTLAKGTEVMVVDVHWAETDGEDGEGLLWYRVPVDLPGFGWIVSDFAEDH